MDEQQINQQQMTFNIKDSTEIVCTSCGNNIFIPGMMLRKISRLIVGSAKDILSPISIPLCSKCHEPVDELLPESLKKPKIQL